MQKFRKGLPESTNVFVCKNTLMRVATEIEEAGQWQLLGKDTEVGASQSERTNTCIRPAYTCTQ
eukprot:1098354-Pelagomonas_calceolata.AAC.2